MSDILFRCVECMKDIVLDDQFIGRTVSCPRCQQRIRVPQPDIHFACAACRRSLGAARAYSGLTVPCPACQTAAQVPVLPEAPRTRLRLRDLPDATPTGDISSNVPLSPQEQAAEPGIAPTVEAKLDLPIYRRDRTLARAVRRRRLATAAKWLVTVAVLLIVLAVVDLGTPPPTTLWRAADESLQAVKDQPESLEAMKRLMAVVRRMDDSPSQATLRSALMTVYALNQVRLEDPRKGIANCRYVASRYPTSPFAAMAAWTNLGTRCTACDRGAKKMQVVCPACGGNGRCPACGSTGHGALTASASHATNTPSEARQDTPLAVSAPPPAIGQKSGPQIGNATGTESTTCPRCHGKGRCRDCRGTGILASGCTECHGYGFQFTRERVQQQFERAVREALAVAARRRMVDGARSLLLHVQDTLRSPFCGAPPAQRTESGTETAAMGPLAIEEGGNPDTNAIPSVTTPMP